MKAQAKYVQLLERELEFLREQLGQSRKDIEFYRGKVERLELSLREAGVAVAAPEVRHVELRPEDAVSQLTRMPSGRLPFSELKRRWSSLTEAEQQKALVDGWNLDTEATKEETNEGR